MCGAALAAGELQEKRLRNRGERRAAQIECHWAYAAGPADGIPAS